MLTTNSLSVCYLKEKRRKLTKNTSLFHLLGLLTRVSHRLEHYKQILKNTLIQTHPSNIMLFNVFNSSIFANQATTVTMNNRRSNFLVLNLLCFFFGGKGGGLPSCPKLLIVFVLSDVFCCDWCNWHVTNTSPTEQGLI